MLVWVLCAQVFAYFGFIMAIIWIQAIAQEIVNILQVTILINLHHFIYSTAF